MGEGDQMIAWCRLAQETFKMRWWWSGGGAVILEMAFNKAQRP